MSAARSTLEQVSRLNKSKKLEKLLTRLLEEISLLENSSRCTACDGAGKVECPKCLGDGEVTCEECGGEGREY